MVKPWILDLCSGFGGASEAWLIDHRYDVIRVENNELLAEVPNTIIADVENWLDWWPQIIEIRGPPFMIWASPPCLPFSLAYGAPQAVAARDNAPYEPDVSLLHSIKQILLSTRPQYWIVENVHGSRKWFQPIFGDIKQTIGPFQLYGQFPRINIDRNFKHSKLDNDKWSSDPLRANHRAKVPIEVSMAVKKATAGQTTLRDFLKS